MNKRYKITKEFRKAIKNSSLSINDLSKKLDFEVKNIASRNSTIREDHLTKLNSLLNLNIRLKRFKQDYAKNLGRYAHSSYPIRKIFMGEDMAEFCGIMLGDGNLNHRGIKIAFDKRNADYMDYVNKLFKKLIGFELKSDIYEKTNQGYLYFYSTQLAEDLTSFGLKIGDKIKNNVGIPNWIKNNKPYVKCCLRGLIDTDGCIYVCKRERQKYIKFTNFNRRLLLEFRDLALQLGYHFASSNKRNVCLYRKNEVIRFINDIKPVRAGAGS